MGGGACPCEAAAWECSPRPFLREGSESPFVGARVPSLQVAAWWYGPRATRVMLPLCGAVHSSLQVNDVLVVDDPW